MTPSMWAALVILNTACSSMRLAVSTPTPRLDARSHSPGLKSASPGEDAYVLEHKIKGWRREKKIALIEGRFGDLPRLSRAGSHKHVEENIQT